MKCPECVDLGLKSQVYTGLATTTWMHFPPFYDEKGKLHHHDKNHVTTSYTCSNGHKWRSSGMKPCWCGWPDNEKRSIRGEVQNSPGVDDG